jgi:hypothetical protein
MKFLHCSLAAVLLAAVGACSFGGPEFTTRGLMAPPAACSVDPRQLGEAEELEPFEKGNGCAIPNPWRVSSLSGVQLSNPATLNCGQVAAVDGWLNGTVQPAATRTFGASVVAIDVAASYSCRARNHVRGSRMSEHGFGNAIDISAFTLADGRKVTVEDGWSGPIDERAFLRTVRSEACGRFNTVLGPGSDRAHHNHFHLDLATRSNGGTYCR